MAIKQRRITCAACGQRETVLRGERGPLTAYCDVCRAERQREQARQRVAALRARRRAAGRATTPSSPAPLRGEPPCTAAGQSALS